jgi:hypothetical protein
MVVAGAPDARRRHVEGRRMQYVRAFAGGVVGGVTALSVLAAARLAGVPVNLTLALEETAGVPLGAPPWFTGFGEALLLAGIVGLLYGGIFEHTRVTASWRRGAILGVVHASLTGLLLALVPAVDRFPAPGFFMVNLGIAGVLLEIGVHLVYGAIVGTSCAARGGTPQTPLGRTLRIVRL